MTMNQYVKINNKRAIIMKKGWKPSPSDTAFIYPGRGDTNKKQWLVAFEDNVRMPNGRPAPFFIMVLTDLEFGPLDVAPDAIRLVRENGFDTSQVVGLKLYPLPEGNEYDLSEIRFYV